MVALNLDNCPGLLVMPPVTWWCSYILIQPSVGTRLHCPIVSNGAQLPLEVLVPSTSTRHVQNRGLAFGIGAFSIDLL